MTLAALIVSSLKIMKMMMQNQVKGDDMVDLDSGVNKDTDHHQ